MAPRGVGSSRRPNRTLEPERDRSRWMRRTRDDRGCSEPAVAPRRSWRQRTETTRTAYLFLLPALLVMAIITFYPLVFQIWMAFTDFQLKNLNPARPGPAFVGLDNFAR